MFTAMGHHFGKWVDGSETAGAEEEVVVSDG